VVVSFKTTIKTTTKKQSEILELIKEKPDYTVAQLAEKLGVSTNGIRYHINKLKKADLIKRVGSTKEGYWQVL
jgi:predicted HTH transcriptional regulator